MDIATTVVVAATGTVTVAFGTLVLIGASVPRGSVTFTSGAAAVASMGPSSTAASSAVVVLAGDTAAAA